MKHLKSRVVAAERDAEETRVDLPPELASLSAGECRRILPKERARAMESALFASRGTPAHAWLLDERQINLAVQIILDEVFPNTPSPFDLAISDSERQELESIMRQQMQRAQARTTRPRVGVEDRAPAEPIRDYGRLLRQGRETIERGEPWYGPSIWSEF